jgi:hypothetical protein
VPRLTAPSDNSLLALDPDIPVSRQLLIIRASSNRPGLFISVPPARPAGALGPRARPARDQPQRRPHHL